MPISREELNISPGGLFDGCGLGVRRRCRGGQAARLGNVAAIGASMLLGGITAEATGGEFWRGAAVAGIVAGANDVAHRMTLSPAERAAREKRREIRRLLRRLQKSRGDVEVYIWNKTNGKDVGHTAIRVDDKVYGYYPTDIDGDGAYTLNDLNNSPGKMHVNSIAEFNEIYRGDNITAYSLNISEAQQRALLSNLMSIASSPGFYSLSGNHCTSIANSCMINAGINIVRPPTPGYGTGVGTIGINMSPHSFQWMLSHPVNSSYISGIRKFTVGD